MTVHILRHEARPEMSKSRTDPATSKTRGSDSTRVRMVRTCFCSERALELSLIKPSRLMILIFIFFKNTSSQVAACVAMCQVATSPCVPAI